MPYEDIADALVAARRAGQAVEEFPGGVPPVTLAAAYRIQDLALERARADIAGWKVGMVRPEFRAVFPTERWAGPVLAGTVVEADGPVSAKVIPGGFNAVEAEFAFQLSRDFRFGDTDPLDAVGACHIAIELVGSPLSTMARLGPGAIIADQGANAGLIIGARVQDWRNLGADPIRILIDDQVAGEGSVANVPRGPAGALAFLAGHLASRSRPLKAGQWISTGATTGLHPVKPGATVRADFGRLGVIDLTLEG